MTTREEYAEAAKWAENSVRLRMKWRTLENIEQVELAARVLRQLAEGAVLCDGEWIMDSPFDNRPLHAAIE
jgi:hypothetical protein